MDTLQGLGYGIIGFAIIIGVGSVVLHKFGGAVATCPATEVWNNTDNTCWNATASTGTPTGEGFINIDYMNTQLGTTGLSGWVPAIIAITIGMLFLGMFLVNRGSRKA